MVTLSISRSPRRSGSARTLRLRDFIGWLFARRAFADRGGVLAGYGLLLCGVAFTV